MPSEKTLNLEDLNIEYLTSLEAEQNLSEDMGQDIIKGLTQFPKSLPAKYFYDERGSQLFEEICLLPEYYLTRTETGILCQSAPEIVRETGACELIELGSGSSTKTRLLLEAYFQTEQIYRYVPIDVSETILKESVIKLKKDYPSLPIQGFIGTYEQALAYHHLTAHPRSLIFFLGSSIGNFTPDECDVFFKKLSQVMQDGDYFLLGIDLEKSPSILEAAYNDSQGITAAFNLNILSHLNWRFQGNFNPNLFIHKAIYNQELSQIEMYLIAQADHKVNLEKLNLTVSFKKGEKLLTEISRKFDLKMMQKALESNKINPVKVFTDEQNLFGLILCKKLSFSS